MMRRAEKPSDSLVSHLVCPAAPCDLGGVGAAGDPCGGPAFGRHKREDHVREEPEDKDVLSVVLRVQVRVQAEKGVASVVDRDVARGP